MRPFQTAALVTILVMAAGTGLFVAARGILGPGFAKLPEVFQSFGATLEEPKVLVLVVRDRSDLEAIRRSVAADRIVASTSDAFALAEGRIVTTRIEAASDPLSAAGWIDRPLEFVDTRDLQQSGGWRPAAGSPARPGGEATASPGERDLSDLYQKETLTVGEALRVIKHSP